MPTKIKGDYENFPALTPDQFGTSKKMTVRVLEPPQIIKTEFRKEQPIIKVQHRSFSPTESGAKIRTWFSNITSYNYLVDKIGEADLSWPNSNIDLYIVRQAMNGEMKEVIYAVGALTKKEEEKRTA